MKFRNYFLSIVFLMAFSSLSYALPVCDLIKVDEQNAIYISKYKSARFLSPEEILSYSYTIRKLPSDTLFATPVKCHASASYPDDYNKRMFFNYEVDGENLFIGIRFPLQALNKKKSVDIIGSDYMYVNKKNIHKYNKDYFDVKSQDVYGNKTYYIYGSGVSIFHSKVQLINIKKVNEKHYAYGAEIQFLDPPHTDKRFTKLGISGRVLNDDASVWACVRDEETGLVWEAKMDDGSIHDKDNRYMFDGWQELLEGSNKERLCGFDDWRIPNNNEADSIKDKTKLLTREKVGSLLHSKFFKYHEKIWTKIHGSHLANTEEKDFFDVGRMRWDTELHLQGCVGCRLNLDFARKHKDRIMTRLVRGPKNLPPIIRPKPSPRMDG